MMSDEEYERAKARITPPESESKPIVALATSGVSDEILEGMIKDAMWEYLHVGSPGCAVREKAFQRVKLFQALLDLRKYAVITVASTPARLSAVRSASLELFPRMSFPEKKDV